MSERNIFDVLKEIESVLEAENEYKEIKAQIDKIRNSISMGYKAPELRWRRWNYVYMTLIEEFIPPKTDIDYQVLAIWTCKSVEELKTIEGND